MLFRNYTPFPPLHFKSRDENQQDFGVLLMRGTFEIEHGKRLRLAESQEQVLFKDEYYGDPQETSMKMETSLAPFKPATDIHVNAIAHSPTGLEEESWEVNFRFGEVRKSLAVTGPRSWEKKLGFRAPTPIEPVRSVPIRYELAFGGSFEKDGQRFKHEENPVGRGFCDPKQGGPIQMPQIFDCLQTARNFNFGQSIPVAGLGPIAPHWAPRSKNVGTYNEMWKKTRFPNLPSDFDFRFYNSASTGLTLDGFATGNEVVTLKNLSQDQYLTFQLPGFELGTLMRFESGELLPGPVLLDSVHIDVPESRVYLTWRSVFPVNIPLRVLEVRAGNAAVPVSQTQRKSAMA